MRSVVKNVILGKDESGIDISDYINSLTFKRSKKHDNVLTITASNSNAEKLLDMPELDRGKPVIFSYGYIQGSMSRTRTAVITDIEPSYTGGEGCSLTITALDKGVSLRKISSNRIWKNMTTAEIVQEIAAAHGLNAVIQDTGGFMKHSSFPQGGMTDIAFLRKLANMEKDGNYTIFVNDKNLYFITDSKGTPSESVVNIKDADKVNKFDIKYRESSLNKKAGEVTMSSHDLQAKVNAATEKTRTVLGEYTIDGKTGAVTDKTGKPIISDPSRLTPNTLKVINDVSNNKATTIQDLKAAGQELLDVGLSGVSDALKNMYTMGSSLPSSTPYPDNPTEIVNVANSLHKKAKKKILTATLVEMGNPSREVNTVITVTGIAKRFVGNWFVEEVTDTVDSDFRTSSSLTKDGLKKGIVKADKVNDTPATDKKDSTVTIFATDRDGHGMKTKAGDAYKVEEGKFIFKPVNGKK